VCPRVDFLSSLLFIIGERNQISYGGLHTQTRTRTHMRARTGSIGRVNVFHERNGIVFTRLRAITNSSSHSLFEYNINYYYYYTSRYGKRNGRR